MAEVPYYFWLPLFVAILSSARHSDERHTDPAPPREVPAVGRWCESPYGWTVCDDTLPAGGAGDATQEEHR